MFIHPINSLLVFVSNILDDPYYDLRVESRCVSDDLSEMIMIRGF